MRGMDSYWKKRRTPFWVIVTLISALTYPLSFGPACWIAARLNPKSPWLNAVYLPIGRFMYEDPGSISGALKWYGGLGIPAGAHVLVAIDGGPRPCTIWVYRGSEQPSISLSIIGLVIFAGGFQCVFWFINRPDDNRRATPPAANPDGPV